jgi:hypothetical protein
MSELQQRSLTAVAFAEPGEALINSVGSVRSNPGEHSEITGLSRDGKRAERSKAMQDDWS